MGTIVNVFERHFLAVCDNKKPDLARKLDVSLKLGFDFLGLLRPIIEIDQVSICRLVAYFLTRDTTFGLPLVL